PDLAEALGFEDRARGVRSIAAEIAHVRAEQPEGPRHDPGSCLRSRMSGKGDHCVPRPRLGALSAAARTECYGRTFDATDSQLHRTRSRRSVALAAGRKA